MRTIRVSGKGRLKVRPDVTRITMTLEGRDPGYPVVLRDSAWGTERLKELLSAFGFAPSDLKTLHFSVDAEYEGYQEEGVYRQRFVGFVFRHVLKVEFNSDNERLGRILYALANCPAKPEFQISYTVKDPEAAKNELLGRAVADAKEKAAVLADAAGVALRAIQSIDYSWGEVNLEFAPMNKAMRASGALADAGRFDMDLEPDDIEVTDTVTILWEIG